MDSEENEGQITKTIRVGTRIEHDTFDEHVNKQQVERLKFLLEQTTVYSKFLADKLKQKSDEAEANPSLKKSGKSKTRKDDSSASFQQPSLITGGKLRDYQLDGVEWLVSLFENGLNGILADEMGLGKTFQCISFLAFLREQGIWGPFLVVTPLSTVANWVSEINRFAPSIPALLYHGSIAEREELRKVHLSKYGPSFPIVVTSYEIAMNDKKYLQRHHWKYMIVDEGHRIKNMNCKLIKELKEYNSANRLLLTGTPLQNNLAELWSLLNFLLPDIFDDLDSFQSWFDFDNLEAGEGAHKILDEEAEHSVISNLHTILKPFLLRRLKVDVEKELPKKKEYLLYAGLSQKQQELYQAILNRKLRDYLSKGKNEKSTENPVFPSGKRRVIQKGQFKEPEIDDSFTVTESSSDSEEIKPKVKPENAVPMHLQNVLMQLRKACNHPYLFDHPVDPDTDEYLIDKNLIDLSGKMQLLDQLLPYLINLGHKVLIFSQMSRMLDILEDYLVFRSIKYCRIDGSVSQSDRSAQMKLFNTDPKIPVFILTTRAGGLGINLVSADTVIFFDSDWNPQMDLQAQDRVHRIGQTKPVIIYRFAVANSVESKILERAGSKRRLEKMVIHRKKFKGKQQYFKDDRILVEDLEAILKTEEAEKFSFDSDKHCLSKEDLEFITDRSEEAFARTLDGSNSAFKVLEEVRDHTMDSLAQMK